MKEEVKYRFEVKTIGATAIDALSSKDRKVFAPAILLCAIEYY